MTLSETPIAEVIAEVFRLDAENPQAMQTSHLKKIGRLAKLAIVLARRFAGEVKRLEGERDLWQSRAVDEQWGKELFEQTLQLLSERHGKVLAELDSLKASHSGQAQVARREGIEACEKIVEESEEPCCEDGDEGFISGADFMRRDILAAIRKLKETPDAE